MRPVTAPDGGARSRRMMTGRSNLDSPSASFLSPRTMMAEGSLRAATPYVHLVPSPRVDIHEPRDLSGSAATPNKFERLSMKDLKNIVSPMKGAPAAVAPESLTPKGSGGGAYGLEDYKAMETRMFAMGFEQGQAKAKADHAPAAPYGGLETTRSARARRRKKTQQQARHAAFQKKTEDHLGQFIKRNAHEMWEYVPTLYHTQRDEHHHLNPDEWLTSKVTDYCASAYGGNLSKMLQTFENKEVVERLSGSHNMRKTLYPTTRLEVPNSLKKESPAIYAQGYDTSRQQYGTAMANLFAQPLDQYMRSTNGGHASTEFRRTKKSLNPMCEPGPMGRTNLAGWADATSPEGVGGRPVFLRGSAFAQAHESF